MGLRTEWVKGAAGNKTKKEKEYVTEQLSSAEYTSRLARNGCSEVYINHSQKCLRLANLQALPGLIITYAVNATGLSIKLGILSAVHLNQPLWELFET